MLQNRLSRRDWWHRAEWLVSNCYNNFMVNGHFWRLSCSGTSGDRRDSFDNGRNRSPCAREAAMRAAKSVAHLHGEAGMPDDSDSLALAGGEDPL